MGCLPLFRQACFQHAIHLVQAFPIQETASPSAPWKSKWTRLLINATAKHTQPSLSASRHGWPKILGSITAAPTQAAIAIKTTIVTATSTADCTLGPKTWLATSALRAGTSPTTKIGKP